MSIIRYAFWGAVGICLIVVGLANRGEVTLRALPDGVADLFGLSPTIDLPLFSVIFMGVAAGLLIGFFWEWIREWKHRAEARDRGKEVTLLKREVRRLKAERDVGKDEVLAILEDAG